MERWSWPRLMGASDCRLTGHCRLPLTTGMDSPVSIDSLTTQPPSSSAMSQGTTPVVTSTMSPTTRSADEMRDHTDERRVCTYDV